MNVTISAHWRRSLESSRIRQRLRAGSYSDDLTDPFRKSQTQVDYQCR